MTRRTKFWLVAVIFSAINLAGAGFAIASGEMLHSATHAALLLVGLVFVWGLAPRREARY